MASSTSKKVVVRRFDREPLQGFVSAPSSFSRNGLELLSLSGTVSTVPLEEIKSVHFVRQFGRDPSQEKRQFSVRPKVEGLWLRVVLRDGEVMEGVAPNNLLQWDPLGYTLSPPDTTMSQKVFVPRAALAEAVVLGVIGSPLRTVRAARKTPPEQMEMFEK